MPHPKIEDINKNVVNWIHDNFVKALIPFNEDAKDFKFQRIDQVSKAWKENDYWIVNVVIEYSTATAGVKTLTFQVNEKGEILGFDSNEPMINQTA